MLFLINKPQPNIAETIKLLGGDEDKEVLLVGDAVFLANEAGTAKFKAVDVEQVYAAKDALEDRKVEVSDDVEVVDYPGMVDLIMEEHDHVVSW